MTLLRPQIDTLRRLQSCEIMGTVAALRGLAIYVDDLPLPVGSLVRLERRSLGASGGHVVRGEVIGFEGPRSIIMLFGSADGIAPGAVVVS
ncbi:MAG: hypothetical protein ACYTE6_06110, partial [Planctomycetota bacterium]